MKAAEDAAEAAAAAREEAERKRKEAETEAARRAAEEAAYKARLKAEWEAMHFKDQIYIDPLTGEKKWIKIERSPREILEYKAKKIQEAEDAERARFVLETLLKSPRFKTMKVESPIMATHFFENSFPLAFSTPNAILTLAPIQTHVSITCNGGNAPKV